MKKLFIQLSKFEKKKKKKTATEYELRLQHCGPLTTWGQIFFKDETRRCRTIEVYVGIV